MSPLHKHLWQNELLNDAQLEEKINELSAQLAQDLSLTLDTIILTDACTRLVDRIQAGSEKHLNKALLTCGQTEEQAENLIQGICAFMHKDNILKRLKSDLGSYHPFDLDRKDFELGVFEAWKPLGVQVHIVPGNALNVPVLSMLEGLMAGNINVLKNTARNGIFAQLFMQSLIACDYTGILKHFIYLFEISSSRADLVQKIINQADVVCVWGGEEAVKSITEMTPSGIRVVSWGHKISFAYFAQGMQKDKQSILDLAADICRRNQQACTSPQCVLVEVEDHADLDAFALQLKNALTEVSDQFIRIEPSKQEQAEITTITHLHQAEIALGRGKVYVADDFSFRVLVDYRSGLQPSPLFRTIWVKPIQRSKIIETLRPFNLYLQTCGLASNTLNDTYELTELLIKAGIERITQVGKQHESYTGEPHDGVYALQRYTKRVGVNIKKDIVAGVPSFAYLKPNQKTRDLSAFEITDKTARQNEINEQAKMFLKSGGSSGVTKIAGYSWEDWNEQMQIMAESYMIGGIHPTDKCAILFSAGNLYGGFIATQNALERINTTSLTISSNLDTKTIAETIVLTQSNVIMGMPSFLRKLFREEHSILKDFKGFEKLVYGGELMTEEQKTWFKNEYGFKEIISPVYASNDALMNGYACKHCGNGEFHVPTKVIDVEILNTERDVPVVGNEVGRILITKKSIKDPELIRYDIGDLAKWITEPCACGHSTPKFKLMGRFGDLVRCGAKFINYREICKLIITQFNYTDDIQMQIDTSADSADLVTIKLLTSLSGQEEAIKSLLIDQITDLGYAVKSKNVNLEIKTMDISGFEIAKASGKVRPIVDLRIQSN